MDVKTVCLGILSLGEATGYEIKKLIEEGPFRHCVEASYGSIYPALARLTSDRLVELREETQNGKPDKKVYSITDRGRRHFEEELLKPPEEDRIRSDFLFILIFSDLLPAHHRTTLIDARLARLKEEQLAVQNHLIGEGASRGARFAKGWRLAMLRTAIAYLEDNRHLLEDQTTRLPGKNQLVLNKA